MTRRRKSFAPVRVNLDFPRELVFDFRAIARFEQESGKPVSGLVAEECGVDMIGTLLWCGLLRKYPRVTKDEAFDLIEFAPGDTAGDALQYVARVVFEGIAEAIGTKEDDESGNVAAADPITTTTATAESTSTS